MTRPSRVRALWLFLALAAGCQDYNFNPVGKCVIQPGNERITLPNISTADVLFVVDDSGSMAGEQAKLAANFSAFINNLNQTNVARTNPPEGIEPRPAIDFHIAVTSTSIFSNEQYQNSATCRTDCGTAAGSPTCCVGTGTAGQPFKAAQACSGPGAACGQGECRNDCQNLKGEYYCCDATTKVAARTQNVACTRVGDACGQLNTHYAFYPGCSTRPGVAVNEWPYPRGEFVSWTNATTANPRVLHFDKELYGAGAKNAQGMSQSDLIAFFSGGTALGQSGIQGNIIVGTCGSGQEQALEAARRAVEKALAGGQKDTFAPSGAAVRTWDPATRVASSAAGWPHENSKLVLVFVGDEDDCSSPESHDTGVVLLPNQGPGTGVPDACERDVANKEYDVVQRYVDYFTGLGRPVGAAFIFPASQTSCGTESNACSAGGLCCQMDCSGSEGVCTQGGSSFCGGQAPGFRLLSAANEFRNRGADVVVGSICDSDFASLLNQIAEILKPPTTLTLPTRPAEGKVTLLRIADTQGVTRKLCKGPAPDELTAAQATAQGFDWWFVPSTNPADPGPASEFVYINHATGKCEANAGETYSADYIGLLPPDGCTARSQCQAALGGRVEDWGCYVPPGSAVGTCVCCAPGSADPACTAP